MLFEKIQLEEGEEVLKVVRKHWFVITSELVLILFMALLPLILYLTFSLVTSLIPEIILVKLQEFNYLISFAVIVWILFSLLTGFMIWTHYYLDLWIVTDRRIILIDQIQFFNRKVSSFRLERLQDIKAIINGIIPTFLNFGTVEAQTAGASESNFLTTGLPDPRGIQSIIQGAVDARLSHLNQLTQKGLD